MNFSNVKNLRINGQNVKVLRMNGVEVWRKRALPASYTQLDYIGSNGTQYINTGYVLNSDIVTYQLKHAEIGSGGNTTLFGSQTIVEPRLTGVLYSSYNSRTCWIGSSASVDCGYSTTLNTINTLELKTTSSTAASCTLNGVTTTFSYYGGLQKVLPIALFANNMSGSPIQKSSLRVYNFKIIDNGTLARDMIPALRNSDNKPGMYDLVNDVFYINSGTGEFIYA